MGIVGTAHELVMNGKRTFERTLEGGDVGMRTFQVESDTTDENELAILAAPGLPLPLSLFPGSTTSLLVGAKPVRPHPTHKLWEVVCDYKSILNQDELERGTNPNPIDRKTRISGQSRTIMVPRRRMLRSPAYQEWSEAGPGSLFTLRNAANSAGDPIDPPVEVAVTEWELHCEKNVQTIPDWVLDVNQNYPNGVNAADQDVTFQNGGSTVTRTIRKGTGKLSNLSFSTLKKENGQFFYTIAWNVTIRVPRPLASGESDYMGAWDVERLDEGLRKRTTSGSETKWTNFRDSSGQSLMTPAAMDGAGNQITTTGAAIPETDLWWFAYRPFGERVDYSIIPWT